MQVSLIQLTLRSMQVALNGSLYCVGKLDSTEGSADAVWKYHTILACSCCKDCLGKVPSCFEFFHHKRIAIYCVLVTASFLVIF